MSYTEIHIGKLRKVDLAGQTIEQWAENECNKLGVTTRSSYISTWWLQFIDEGNNYKKYFMVRGEIWEAFDHIEFDEDQDIDQFIPQPDGTIHFVTKFYNGGTCLSEMVEEGVDRVGSTI